MFKSKMFDYSLVRMFERAAADELTEHIDSLPPDDKYLRFGYNVSRSQIAEYVFKTVNHVNTRDVGSYWFGIYDKSKLVASLHVAIAKDCAEFAFTTATEYRGQKLGQLLFARGYQLITEFQITKIYLACLTKNAPMRHIAKKFGMSVMTHGADSEAAVNIQYPVPLSRLNEVKICMIDKDIAKCG